MRIRAGRQSVLTPVVVITLTNLNNKRTVVVIGNA